MKRLLFACLLIALTGLSVACDKNSDTSADEEPTATETEETDESAGDEESEQATEESSDEASETSETDGGDEADGESVEVDPALMKPGEADEKAPETYRVRFETTAGDIVGEFHREWAPKGADRLYNLVKIGFYDDVAFFRVIDGFMAQFGMKGIPKVDAAWEDATIEDDPVEKSNKRGMITFAKRRDPNSRTTQLFINDADNSESLDQRGFAPVGEVVEGMDVLDELYAGYGEGAPRGDGPSQKTLREEGNSHLRENFPKLDWIESAEIIKEDDSGGE